jgi:hypothetical protein
MTQGRFSGAAYRSRIERLIKAAGRNIGSPKAGGRIDYRLVFATALLRLYYNEINQMSSVVTCET